jgi:hypothetical protein
VASRQAEKKKTFLMQARAHHLCIVDVKQESACRSTSRQKAAQKLHNGSN